MDLGGPLHAVREQLTVSCLFELVPVLKLGTCSNKLFFFFFPVLMLMWTPHSQFHLGCSVLLQTSCTLEWLLSSHASLQQHRWGTPAVSLPPKWSPSHRAGCLKITLIPSVFRFTLFFPRWRSPCSSYQPLNSFVLIRKQMTVIFQKEPVALLHALGQRWLSPDYPLDIPFDFMWQGVLLLSIFHRFTVYSCRGMAALRLP